MEEAGEELFKQTRSSEEKRLSAAPAVGSSAAAINNTFPRAAASSASICTFSQLFCRVEIEGDPNVGCR